ncbi:hypothetical protein TRFO_03077 [Tritrichomonas foetus]|uniref:Uncharacterized protein n=1 Tax=Tritrichomonas foetus TaxID=1144522 RepID=A0A1J4KV61_9EUKA|nr:hypothetical protein TRFO_03077 [Tritrichomonas foetus]|eukprot:OHT14784.1 hypothetical protein TRFO_03077 [Tritrichomonas foetus]
MLFKGEGVEKSLNDGFLTIHTNLHHLTVSNGQHKDVIDQNETDLKSLGNRESAFQWKSDFLFHEMQIFSLTTHIKVLGLHLDKNGNFLDRDISMKCLKLFEKHPIPFFVHFDLLLCAILVRKNRLFVENHLNNLKLNEKQIQANDSTLSLINKYAGKPLNVKWISSNVVYGNNYDVVSAFEESENRKSVIKSHIEIKIVHEFLDLYKKNDNEIAAIKSLQTKNNLLYFEDQIRQYHTNELEKYSENEIQWNNMMESIQKVHK